MQLERKLLKYLDPSPSIVGVCHRVPQSSERVEYAIKLPGQGEEPVYLPWLTLNSHWKTTIVWKLMNQERRGDRVLHGPLLLVSSVLLRISNKIPLSTSDNEFPNSLFANRRPLFREWFAIQNSSIACTSGRTNFTVAGPSTLSALLNSLSVGFKTLSIQKECRWH